MQKGLTMFPTNPVDFSEFLRLLHEQRFTGSFVTHCRGGVPVYVDTGRPHRITLRQSRNLTASDSGSHTPD